MGTLYIIIVLITLGSFYTEVTRAIKHLRVHGCNLWTCGTN